MIFGYSILATALLLSLTAAYYSVAGLTAIFAAATLPVVIMGGTLELGKVVATVWLHNNWKRAPWQFKAYLIPAVVFLMLLTSMGIFGFLSKAHLDQAVPTGDVAAKVQILDEKIKTERDNIESARRALIQMDGAVDQTLSRSTDEKGADKAAQLRRSQAKERGTLQNEIAQAQKKIAVLNEERAPIASELRKVEAEVGPIKYIAALIYDESASQDILEKAVRFVIIMIVMVFDPLALCLILASNKQFEWARQGTGGFVHDEPKPTNPSPKLPNWLDRLRNRFKKTEETEVDIEQVNKELADARQEPTADNIIITTDAEAEAVVPPGTFFRPEPEVKIVEKIIEKQVPVVDPKVQEELNKALQALDELATDYNKLQEQNNTSLERSLNLQIQNEDLKKQITALNNPMSITERPGDYVDTTPPENMPVIEPIENSEYVRVDGKIYGKDSLNVTLPDLVPQADNAHKKLAGSRASFGTEFPDGPRKGDLFLRVDSLPSRLYKWNGLKWLEIDKTTTDSYAYNEKYIEHLISQIEAGAYDADDLNDAEREQIEQYLKGRDAQ